MMTLLSYLAVGAIAAMLGYATYTLVRGVFKKSAKKDEASHRFDGTNPLEKGLQFTPEEEAAKQELKNVEEILRTADIDSEEYKEAEESYLDTLRFYLSDDQIADIYREDGYDELDIPYMVDYANDGDLRDRTPSRKMGRKSRKKRLYPVGITGEYGEEERRRIKRGKKRRRPQTYEEFLQTPLGKFAENFSLAEGLEKERAAYEAKKKRRAKVL